MAFFDQIYDRLFAPKPKGVILHEVINRSTDYKTRFESWKKSYKSTDLLKEVAVSYAAKLAGMSKKPEVHILNDKLSNGFAVTYTDQIGKEAFQFLFDYLAQKTATLGYRLTNSDYLITDKGHFTETKEKHYLKPTISTESVIDQQFGNILIEHVLVDDQPSYIRLAAHGYSDRSYQPPLPFHELMNHLFPN